MINPIIEKLQANIHDRRTAEYFGEVLSCYYSGNLRSAVVMLYSTTICDLVYKLEELRDVYEDKGAKQILKELEKQQKNNPKNTDWEKAVPEKCKDANKILTVADYSNFCSLQQLRHLCAHPVLGEDRELYMPNADIVLGHIRNMLEGVFIKPAFQTNALFDLIVNDIDDIKSILIEEKKFVQYIEVKYFNKFNSVELEYSIFKKLWKFVFYIDNPQCNENRRYNYWTLDLLLSRHKDFIISKYEKDKDYFAKNIEIHNKDLFTLLIKLFNIYLQLFEVLPDDKKIEIKEMINHDDIRDYKAIALFLVSDKVNYAFSSKFKDTECALYVVKYLYNLINKDKALNLAIKLYGDSNSFDMADSRFSYLIERNLSLFSVEQLKLIIEQTCKNGQIYGRGQAVFSNRKIKDALLKKCKDFDFAPYSNFRY